MISGYNVNDWISDIQCKVEEKKSQTALAELTAIEVRLSGLLSDDKKIEIELDDIEQLLGE